ncbi:MAG: xanthine dehydrogenase family protein subunit M [Acidimicrobiia bacterium]|nr:xanthine dehydrogenase family protein subunit M [Acidimicrobiia bacterium]MDH4308846.1 xanthine dehydrogenase family protein subunit M [Acidimicrobiia bacterium]MDH5292696.1 xanthine dehydrogenase family protein subunit M [Acidimicrobiia bacterium]
MYPPVFDYVRAGSIEEALDLVNERGGKFLAGGHSLLPVMKMRLADPGLLVDIGRVDGLRGISRKGEYYTVGALTTHAEVAAVDDGGFPAALLEAAGMIGDPQVRNRGTVGGNVAHADPASDLPPVFAALGATMVVASNRGKGRGAMQTREIAATEFFTGLFETALADDELLVSVNVSAEGPGVGSAYAKLYNKASRYAAVGVCARLAVGADGACTSCTVAVGGLVPNATVLTDVGAGMLGRPVDSQTIAAAARVAAAAELDVMSDIHASARYRRQMLPVFVARALTSAGERSHLGASGPDTGASR